MSNEDVRLSEISDCELHAFNMVPLLVKGFSPPLIEANAELTGISISRRVLFGSVAHLKLTVVFYASQSVCISLSLLSPNSYANYISYAFNFINYFYLHQENSNILNICLMYLVRS